MCSSQSCFILNNYCVYIFVYKFFPEMFFFSFQWMKMVNCCSHRCRYRRMSFILYDIALWLKVNLYIHCACNVYAKQTNFFGEKKNAELLFSLLLLYTFLVFYDYLLFFFRVRNLSIFYY